MARRGLGWALLLTLAACAPDPGGGEVATPLQQTLGGDPDPGFERALRPRPIRLPQDHGAHPAFRTEWWYFTGHLKADGREFGYQLTFFRQALAPGAPAQNPDRWAAGQLYLAHFTVSDLSGGEFYTAERLARGAQGEAYAAGDRLEVKVVDWSARAEGSALVLRSSAPWGALELDLTPAAPLLLHGDRGLSPKGAGPGNASYYYSLPELTTSGAITVDGVRFSVTGASWLDREWSTSVLSPEQVGWDWFSVNLGEGRYLMLFQLRDASGAPDSYSAGTLVTPAAQHQLTAADFTLRPGRRWRSPVSGVAYPVAWSIEIPAQQLKLEVEPLLDAQELNLTFRYWEGAVRATGRFGAQPVHGQGYLEMTGYE